MSYFKLAVFGYIPNFRFRHPYRWYSTLASNAAVGTTTLTVNNFTAPSGSGISASKFLQNGDKITLGTSTASGYSGKTENVIIKNATSNTITLESGLVYGYSSGDSISGTGSRCPDKFYPKDDALTPQGILQPNDGYSDRWALKFYGANTGIIRISELGDIFDDSLYYKIGMWRKVDYSSGGASSDIIFYCDVADGVNIAAAWFQMNRNDSTTSWTETGKIFPSAATCQEASSSSNRFIDLGLAKNSGSPSMICWIDDIYLENSDPTDTKTETMNSISSAGGLTNIRVVDITGFSIGDTVLLSGVTPAGYSPSLERNQAEGIVSSITASSNEILVNLNSSITIDRYGTLRKKGDCYYQFPDYPEFGSVQVKRISPFQFENIAGKLRGISTVGDASKEEIFEISMTFDQVSTTFYKNVIKYIRRQETGDLLILHTENLIPELSLPFLVGFAQIDQDSKNHWDKNYCTFNFKFTGY